MKFISPYSDWKHSQLLIEAVVNIDDNIVSIIKRYQTSPNASFKAIADKLIEIIGKDLPTNKYDKVSLSNDTFKDFSVTMGRQVNSQSIAKVISNLLVASGINPNVSAPKEEIKRLMDEKGLSESDAKKEINKGILIKQDTIQKFADELAGVIKLSREKTVANNPNEGFKIVSGEDIIRYYSVDMVNTTYKHGDVENEYRNTELMNSCMADKEAELQIYAMNPEKIQLVVKLINGKVDARALLWKLDANESEKAEYFLDRIYFNNPEDRSNLKTWVNENVSNVLYRFDWLSNQSRLSVSLRKVVGLVNHYPYMDSFKFLYIKLEDGKLSNPGIVATSKMEDSDLPDGEWIEFIIQNTRGERLATSDKNKKYENNRMVDIVVDSTIKYELDGSLNDLDLLVKYYDLSDMLVTRKGDLDDGYYKGHPRYRNYYFLPRDLVGSVYGGSLRSGRGVPKYGAILIRNVEDVLKQNPTIKTKLDGKYKYIEFKSLYDTINYGHTYDGDCPRIPFKFLTDLDCRIIGIYDMVKDQKKMYYPHEFIYDGYNDQSPSFSVDPRSEVYSTMRYLFLTPETERLFKYKNQISDYYYDVEESKIKSFIEDRLKPAKIGIGKRIKDFLSFK